MSGNKSVTKNSFLYGFTPFYVAKILIFSLSANDTSEIKADMQIPISLCGFATLSQKIPSRPASPRLNEESTESPRKLESCHQTATRIRTPQKNRESYEVGRYLQIRCGKCRISEKIRPLTTNSEQDTESASFSEKIASAYKTLIRYT